LRLDKLQAGKTFKNYKELCKELEMPVKTSNSKKAQLKELQRYCKLIKSGHSFTVVEVYNTPLKKLDNRGKNSIYNDLIQTLIIDYLLDSNKKINYITKHKLLKYLQMINDNYTYCSKNIPYLSIYTNIDEYIIQDFFNTSNSNFQHAIENALYNLRDKSIAISEKVIMVCNKNFIHKEATDKDKDIILQCEKEILNEFNFKELTHVRISNRWEDFKIRLTELLQERSDIVFYYVSYKITANEKMYILNEYNYLMQKLIDFYMSDIDKKDKLNEIICERLIQNAIRRKNLINNNKKINEARQINSYIEDNKILIDLLINKNAKDIRIDISRIKQEEIEKWHEEWGFLSEIE